VHVNRYKLIVS